MFRNRSLKFYLYLMLAITVAAVVVLVLSHFLWVDKVSAEPTVTVVHSSSINPTTIRVYSEVTITVVITNTSNPTYSTPVNMDFYMIVPEYPDYPPTHLQDWEITRWAGTDHGGGGHFYMVSHPMTTITATVVVKANTVETNTILVDWGGEVDELTVTVSPPLPVISSVEPVNAVPGDRVTVYGQYFTWYDVKQGSDMWIWFVSPDNEVVASVSFYTEGTGWYHNAIQLILPPGLEMKTSYKLTVFRAGVNSTPSFTYTTGYRETWLFPLVMNNYSRN